jgi:hypothetical protein
MFAAFATISFGVARACAYILFQDPQSGEVFMAEESAEEKDRRYTIIVNGTQELWTDHRISYRQVVQLAFPGSAPEELYTVSYASPQGRDGMLAPGQETEIKNGMSFNVVKTNRS